MKEKVIIVGAGLVGSLWALFMARRGYKVDVYERRGDMRAAGFVGGRSINLAMSTRGWKALEKAGVIDLIRDNGLPMHGRMMHDTEGNLTYQAYGKEGEAIYSVSRGGLNLELIEAADKHPNVDFHFNHRCRHVDVRKNILHFENEAKDKIEIEADLIFGADGAYSAVRWGLQKTPRFNYSQEYLDYGYKELTFSPKENGEAALKMGSLHIWPRGSFMLIALPNLDNTFTGTLFMPYKGDPGFDDIHTDEDVKQFFEKYFPDAMPIMPELYDDFRDNPTGDLITVRCDPWQYGEKILLMGDASHAIVPFYGQGMNSGFEDCSVLDEMADEYNEDWPMIIRKFSEIRVKDANAIADLALRNFIEMRDLVGDPMFLLRKKIAGHLHKKYPEFMPVYSMVSFSNIPYSQALAEAGRQDVLFEKILAIDGIEEKWNGSEVEAIFKEWLKTKK